LANSLQFSKHSGNTPNPLLPRLSSRNETSFFKVCPQGTKLRVSPVRFPQRRADVSAEQRCKVSICPLVWFVLEEESYLK
jgi:hypothetical protein